MSDRHSKLGFEGRERWRGRGGCCGGAGHAGWRDILQVNIIGLEDLTMGRARVVLYTRTCYRELMVLCSCALWDKIHFRILGVARGWRGTRSKCEVETGKAFAVLRAERAPR